MTNELRLIGLDLLMIAVFLVARDNVIRWPVLNQLVESGWIGIGNH